MENFIKVVQEIKARRILVIFQSPKYMIHIHFRKMFDSRYLLQPIILYKCVIINIRLIAFRRAQE